MTRAAATPARWRPDRLAAQLDSRWRPPVLTTSTGSTNDDIARIARDHGLAAGEWSLVATWHQRAGRGRRGHTWSARAGDGLLLSVATRLHVPATRWPSASLIVGHALVELIEALLPAEEPKPQIGLKWPNDLLVGAAHRKLGGILCERVTAPDANHDGALWVAGVGLNLHAPTEAQLARVAVGLTTLLPAAQRTELCPSSLLGQVASGIQRHIDAWQLRGGFLLPGVHGRALRFRDAEVGLDLGDGRRVPAWLCGIDRSGALRVRDVVGGQPVGPERSVTPLRILDAQTTPPWSTEST